MVYKNNFVAVVKCEGKILREKDEVVYLKFGSEYSLLLKNLDSRKAVVAVHIDGKDVLDEHRVIVYPNSELELKGFKKQGAVRNKFKFIQKTEDTVKQRGDRIDDGVIRVEVTFEKRVEEVVRQYQYSPQYWHTNWAYTAPWDTSAIYCSNNVTYTNSAALVNSDEGITVEGSETHQDFVPACTKELEDVAQVIVLRLRGIGESSGVKIEKSITTKEKVKCKTCGKKSRSSATYCSKCGTHL